MSRPLLIIYFSWIGEKEQRKLKGLDSFVQHCIRRSIRL
jgi:hypothetical protein